MDENGRLRQGFGKAKRKVLVVEDDPGWQDIYKELIEDLSLATQIAVSYGEARGWLERERFDLAIIDLRLISSTQPEYNKDGFRLLRATHQKAIPTIVVTALAEPDEVDQAFDEFDVFAFLDKGGFARSEFIRTVQDALVCTPVVPGQGLDALTPREHEVLALLAQGKTNKEIAEELVVSANTVKKHVYSIFSKLGVSTRSAATSLAIQTGLIEIRQPGQNGS